MMWWHKKILGHFIAERMVSVPIFDMSAKGILYVCVCGKVWTR